MMTPQRCGQILQGRIAQQEALYRQLLEISRRQLQSLRAGHFDRLPTAVAERDTLLARLTVQNRLAARFRDYWSAHADLAPSALADEIAAALARIPQVLRELTAADQELKAESQQRLDEIRADLGRVKRGMQITTAYMRPRISQPRFISRMCN